MSIACAVSLALVISAAEPSSAVLVARRTSIAAKEAQQLAEELSKHLAAAGVPLKYDADAARAALSRLGLKDSAQCSGKRGCVTELGRQLGVTLVIAVSLSQIGSDRSIAVELLDVEKGDVLEKDALIVPLHGALEADAVAGFGGRVRKRVAPAVSDQPKVEAPRAESKLSPPAPPIEPPPVPVVPPPVPRSHAPSWVMGGAGVVALGAAAALLVSGLGARSDALRTTRAPDGTLHSPYPASEALSRAHGSDVQLGVAAGAGAVGVGLGAAAVIAW